jgi:hypothetical protein
VLLEAEGIAGGASGKAGGLLARWAYPSCLVGLSYGLHEEVSCKFLSLFLIHLFRRWGRLKGIGGHERVMTRL